ncbi:hypothetical protein AK812_SmicGene21826 [Symbiodinium microadriaticum]|uniref:Uncharacterized protein n=1 Tax=Symbiodinium microadriaticum TaxID=2951 RepID=A0A1Q9DLJ3_SYMMI|nr:hypothetical protein AK812_SmicGene21826 [Symbiodinium microadriaticum]
MDRSVRFLLMGDCSRVERLLNDTDLLRDPATELTEKSLHSDARTCLIVDFRDMTMLERSTIEVVFTVWRQGAMFFRSDLWIQHGRACALKPFSPHLFNPSFGLTNLAMFFRSDLWIQHGRQPGLPYEFHRPALFVADAILAEAIWAHSDIGANIAAMPAPYSQEDAQEKKKSAQKCVAAAEKTVGLLDEKIRNLTAELSHVRAVFATRPLLELGLAKFEETNQHLAGDTWTGLSRSFLSDALFENDEHLQDWAKQKLKRLNRLFSWQIQWDDARFGNCLWNLYPNFSEKYHEVSSEVPSVGVDDRPTAASKFGA